MHWKRIPKTYDYLLALAVIGLGVFGVAMIYSSVFAPSVSAALSPHLFNNMVSDRLWQRQLFFVVSGAVLMIGFSLVDYHFITRFYLYIYGFMIFILMLALFVFGADDGTNVARSIWVPVPFFGRISMMPSEFAKIFMIIFLAKFLDICKDNFNKPLWLLLILVLIVLPVYLVFEQPSLSASVVVLGISLTVLFVGGLYWRTIIVAAAVIAPIGVVIWFDLQRAAPIFITRFISEWQWRRIETFMRPQYASLDDIRQTEGSVEAIISGGLTGRGFMENPYVILGHNDFIFSVSAAQFGFAGSAVLLGVVAFVIVRCVLTASKAKDLEGRLIAAGVAGMLIFETFFHVGVATDLLPNTGMPFPFLSYGGSMIWVHMIAVGIVLNIGLPRKPKSIFDDEDSEQ